MTDIFIADVFIIAIPTLAILLLATTILFPLIKLKKKEGGFLGEQPTEQPQEPDTECEPQDLGAQVIVNIEHYHEAKPDLPLVRCEHCGTKNKGDSRKCEDCGATL